MIQIWFRHYGQRPEHTAAVRSDAAATDVMPESAQIEGVQYGRLESAGEYNHQQLGLRVNVTSDGFSEEWAESLAAAFASNWGGTVEYVDWERLDESE